MAQLSVAAHDNTARYYITPARVTPSPAIPTTSGALPFRARCRSTTSRPDLATVSTSAPSTPTVQPATTFRTWRQVLVPGRPLLAPTWAASSERLALGVAPDSVFNFGGQQQLISTWGMRGAFNHNWNPNWTTSIYGAYAEVNYGSNTAGGSAANVFCAGLMQQLTRPVYCSASPPATRTTASRRLVRRRLGPRSRTWRSRLNMSTRIWPRIHGAHHGQWPLWHRHYCLATRTPSRFCFALSVTV